MLIRALQFAVFSWSIIISTVVSAQPTAPAGSASYSQLISSSEPNLINGYLPPDCLSAARKHLASKQKLSTNSLLSSVTTVGETNFGDVADGVFFHYTNSDQQRQAAITGDKESFFQFRKLAPEKAADRVLEPDLYVAGDASSSAEFGKYQVQIIVSKDAKIFVPTSIEFWSKWKVSRVTPDQKSAYSDYIQQMRSEISERLMKVQDEMLAHESELSVCRNVAVRNERYSSDYNLPILVILGMEQEHIGLNAYFGVGLPWFQILDSWAIDEVKLGPSENPGSTLAKSKN